MIKEIREMMYEMATVWFYLLLLTMVLLTTLMLTPFVLLHRLYTHIYEGVIYERETEDGNDQRSKARGACRWIYRRTLGRKVS